MMNLVACIIVITCFCLNVNLVFKVGAWEFSPSVSFLWAFCSIFPQAAELRSVHAVLNSNIVVKRNNCTSQITQIIV